VTAPSFARRLPGDLRPPLADAALAVAFAIAGVAEMALTVHARLAVLVPVVAVTTIPIAWRRAQPFRGLVVTVVAVALGAEHGYPLQATYLLFDLIVQFYSLGAWLDLDPSWPRAVAALAAMLGLFALHAPALDNFTFITLFYGGAWLVGALVRRPRERALTLERDADTLQARHHAAARRAAEQERALIARELHDVVAHSVSVMVIQTGAVRRRLGESRAVERDALADVERVGREALDEMRRMLGILRNDGERPALAPQPGVRDLERLVDQTRGAGLDVEFRLSGTGALPAGLELTVYRVVQEALTNALRHAGGTRAVVAVAIGARAVDVSVRDDGRGAAAVDGPGHGLIGMRERVAIYGGTFAAGPVGSGGFEVRVRLPLTLGTGAA
jgi:signal transduction histidine kinase